MTLQMEVKSSAGYTLYWQGEGKSKEPLSLETERGEKEDLSVELRTKHQGIVSTLSKSKWT